MGSIARSVTVIMALSSTLFSPAAVLAQDKSAFRKGAAGQIIELKKLGEPKDRCSLGVNIGDGAIISRINESSQLAAGDHIVTLNGVSVLDGKAQDIVKLLRSIEPTATVKLTITRNEVAQTVDVKCSNSRAYYERVLVGLEQASSGKFDDCVNSFSREAYDTYSATMRLQCASFSKNQGQYDFGQMSYDAHRLLIEEAHWFPSLRPEATERLHQVENFISQRLGSSKYLELVQLAKKWPGDALAFENSKPDWALFRRNSEISLKNSLIDPDSAKFEWTHGFLFGTWKPILSKKIEGYWTCGKINARNRMGGFAGTTAFVVVLNSRGDVQYSQMGSNKDYDILEMQCINSLSLLPIAPPELSIAQSPMTIPASASLADELLKLSKLRDSGAITADEYDAAKKKLLGV